MSFAVKKFLLLTLYRLSPCLGVSVAGVAFADLAFALTNAKARKFWFCELPEMERRLHNRLKTTNDP